MPTYPVGQHMSLLVLTCQGAGHTNLQQDLPQSFLGPETLHPPMLMLTTKAELVNRSAPTAAIKRWQ